MVVSTGTLSTFTVRDTAHWGQAETVVACDRIGPEARDVFTTGWCWALAEALTALHGGTIVCVGDDDGIWTHVLARIDGHLYDIAGPVTDDEVRATWSGQLWDADADTITDFPLTSANPDAARTFAAHIARLVAVTTATPS